MAGAVEKKIFEIADKIAEELGFFVVDIEYKKEGKNKILRLYIDKTGGIGIDECEIFSRRLDEILDDVNIINEAYMLEVSSPGVDRILKTEREFNYYLGRIVDVKLYKAQDSIKEFSGILKSYENKTVVIQFENKEITLPLSDCAYIRLHFEI